MSERENVGRFVISLDAELAWGSVHRGGAAGRDELFRKTREVVPRLLDLFERHDTQATWAVVGHLLMESCERHHGTKHPEVLRPTYDWFSGDWFEQDPCTDVATDPFWYAPDLIEQVLACQVPQEIGCHGFSHMIAGDPGCSPEAFDSELAAASNAAAPWGVHLDSFVYPRNSIGHVDLLAVHGYTTFRGVAPTWYSRLPGRLQRIARGADAVLPLTPPTSRPTVEQGLWNIPASYHYLHRGGWARFVPLSIRVRKAVAGLRKAGRESNVFHLWFHPFNIATDADGLLGALEQILRESGRLRAEGLLINQTMRGVAASMLESEGALA